MRGRIQSVIAMIFVLVLLQSINVKADTLYFIDSHSQVDHKITNLEKIIKLMKKGGVRHTILSARGQLKGKDLTKFASKYPNKITPAVRTKGKPYDRGSPKYYKMLKQQVTSGQYFAMAETLLYHAKKGNKAPEYDVKPDDKRVVTALNYAIDKGWPFVIHIEFGALDGKKKKRFMSSLKGLLNKYPEQPFVLTHMGQLKSNDCQQLINPLCQHTCRLKNLVLGDKNGKIYPGI